MRHSVYILNRLPTRALSGVTPYEAWCERKPDVGHIRVFGCIGHMKVPSNQVSKLSDRSRVVINLGKEPETKAYRVYDPETGSLHVSRDVVFEEEKGWNWEKMQTMEGEQQDTFTVYTSNTGVLRDESESEGQQAPLSVQSSMSERKCCRIWVYST